MWGHVADLHMFEFGPEKNIQDYHKLTQDEKRVINQL